MSMIQIQRMKLSKDKLNTLFFKTQSTFNFISLLLKYLFFSYLPSSEMLFMAKYREILTKRNAGYPDWEGP